MPHARSRDRSGLYSQPEDGDTLDVDEDLYQFWERSTELLVGLRELHEARR
jgi:hypothetical protein